MLKCVTVAITGGVGSGKSSVCRILSDCGAYCVNADAVVHRLLSPETKIGQEVSALLGAEVVVSGHFDRAKIAKKVFNEPKLLHALEEILHPAAREEIRREYQKVKKAGRYPLFVVEAPLLYEARWDSDFDLVVAVIAEESLCRARFAQKEASENATYDKRMAHQIDPEKKAERADYVIVNNGDLHALSQTVKQFYAICLTGDAS